MTVNKPPQKWTPKPKVTPPWPLDKRGWLLLGASVLIAGTIALGVLYLHSHQVIEKVKTVTVFETLYGKNTRPIKKYMLRLENYDTKGNLTRIRTYNAQNLKESDTRIMYDSLNHKTLATTVKYSLLDSTVTQEKYFWQGGKMIGTMIDADNYTNYDYNKEGKLSHEIRKFSMPITNGTSEVNYQYSKKTGQLEECIEAQNAKSITTKFIYSPDGQLYISKTEDTTGVYDYGKNERLATETHEIKRMIIKKLSYKYEYYTNSR